ncbi:MAG: UbiX family flavin prenyltransferase [Bacteroidetes bacterium]|nr:UbiX family flavin prenyltransferase [Bacteroidota bacterium]MBL0095103.1 UbiX family flavin prenyltransferase [Bacteroidota bacterium]
MKKHKIVVGVTGASGAIYAKILLEKLTLLQDQLLEVAVVFSDNARDVWEYELGHKDYSRLPFKVYDKGDFMAPFASGSARFETMIICPCSMGTMARIAHGISGDLITRAADVILKERRKLILVTRDTPLSLIHIDNMRTITMAGGIIAPASPSFYSKPESLENLAATVVDRVLDLAGLENVTYRWSES